MTDKTAIRQRLCHCLDMGCARRAGKFALMVFAGIALFFLLKLDMLELPVRIGLSLLLPLLMVLPELIYCGWLACRVLRKPEGYILGRVKLDQPLGGRLRGTVRFRVILDAGNGRQIQAVTHSIFWTRSLFDPEIESYVNREVDVAYNDETDVLVVLG